jgi:MFS family permease
VRKDPFLYLLAFAMDACAGLVGLCVPLVAMGIGADYDDLGAIGASGSVAYSLGCLLSGRLADRLGYRRLMTLASLGQVLVFCSYLLVDRVWHLFVISVVSGAAISGFWPSLQAWLGQGHDRRGLLLAIGRFNVAWSLGFLVGPALGGYLYAANPNYVFGAAAVSVTLILLGLLALPVRPGVAASGSRESASLAAARRFLPVAWVANFATFFASGTVRALFPKHASDLGIEPESLGWLVSLIGLAQAVAFLLVSRTDRWQFRLAPLVCVQLLAAAGLWALALGRSPLVFAVGLVLQGGLVAVTFTASIFYSLHADGPGGRRTGLHEAIVGSGFLAGPLVGGLVAEHVGPGAPYLAASAVVLAAIAAQAYVVRRVAARDLAA